MIDLLNIVRPPNSLSVISLALAEIALKDIKFVQENIRYIINERERCKKILDKIKGVQVYRSDANFLLLKFNKLNPNKIYNLLLQKGLIVRNVSNMVNLEKCLRFNIRTSAQNDILLTAFSEIIKNN
jgi:histidinol-phosphate aminotransferase